LLSGKPHEIAITFANDAIRVTAADTPELRARMTRMFQLHVDMSEFIAVARVSADHAWVETAGFGRLLC